MCCAMQWGGWEGVISPRKNVTNVYVSMLLALRGGGWVGVKFPGKVLCVDGRVKIKLLCRICEMNAMFLAAFTCCD